MGHRQDALDGCHNFVGYAQLPGMRILLDIETNGGLELVCYLQMCQIALALGESLSDIHLFLLKFVSGFYQSEVNLLLGVFFCLRFRFSNSHRFKPKRSK